MREITILKEALGKLESIQKEDISNLTTPQLMALASAMAKIEFVINKIEDMEE